MLVQLIDTATDGRLHTCAIFIIDLCWLRVCLRIGVSKSMKMHMRFHLWFSGCAGAGYGMDNRSLYIFRLSGCESSSWTGWMYKCIMSSRWICLELNDRTVVFKLQKQIIYIFFLFKYTTAFSLLDSTIKKLLHRIWSRMTSTRPFLSVCRLFLDQLSTGDVRRQTNSCRLLSSISSGRNCKT